MKSSLNVLVAILGVLSFSDAFTCTPTNNLKHHTRMASHSSHDDAITINSTIKNLNKSLPKVASFASALALGWGVVTSTSIASASISPSAGYSPSTISSITVAAIDSISAADVADFSLPSYGDVVAAEKNSNLKGTTNLLGEEYTKKGSPSEAPKEVSTVSTKEDKEAKAAAKAARRAEMKVARERQMAEAEAALK